MLGIFPPRIPIQSPNPHQLCEQQQQPHQQHQQAMQRHVNIQPGGPGNNMHPMHNNAAIGEVSSRKLPSIGASDAHEASRQDVLEVVSTSNAQENTASGLHVNGVTKYKAMQRRSR
ncbi:GRF1-interacting factor [Ancistrocladus abbreviatus]